MLSLSNYFINFNIERLELFLIICKCGATAISITLCNVIITGLLFLKHYTTQVNLQLICLTINNIMRKFYYNNSIYSVHKTNRVSMFFILNSYKIILITIMACLLSSITSFSETTYCEPISVYEEVTTFTSLNKKKEILDIKIDWNSVKGNHEVVIQLIKNLKNAAKGVNNGYFLILDDFRKLYECRWYEIFGSLFFIIAVELWVLIVFIFSIAKLAQFLTKNTNSPFIYNIESEQKRFFCILSLYIFCHFVAWLSTI